MTTCIPSVTWNMHGKHWLYRMRHSAISVGLEFPAELPSPVRQSLLPLFLGAVGPTQ